MITYYIFHFKEPTEFRPFTSLPRVNEFLKSTIILKLYETDIYKERQVPYAVFSSLSFFCSSLECHLEKRNKYVIIYVEYILFKISQYFGSIVISPFYASEEILYAKEKLIFRTYQILPFP